MYHNKLYCKYLSGHNDNFKVSEKEGMHFLVHRIEVNYIVLKDMIYSVTSYDYHMVNLKTRCSLKMWTPAKIISVSRANSTSSVREHVGSTHILDVM